MATKGKNGDDEGPIDDPMLDDDMLPFEDKLPYREYADTEVDAEQGTPRFRGRVAEEADPGLFRVRLYPITYLVMGAVAALAAFHATTYEPGAPRIPFGEEWMDAAGGVAGDVLVERIATLCALGPGQNRRALPENLRGARGGSPSQVDANRVRLIALDADGNFLVEGDRRRTGRAPTVDAVDPAWCAPVSAVRVESYPGVDGLGEGVKLRRVE